MNSNLNKSNLHFELMIIKLVLIYTNQVMDVESLDSTQNNSNLIFLILKIWIYIEIWISIPSVDLSQNSTLELNSNPSYLLKPKFNFFTNFKCMQFNFPICNQVLNRCYSWGHYRDDSRLLLNSLASLRLVSFPRSWSNGEQTTLHLQLTMVVINHQ
jgi:hypothetical protein